MAAASAAEMVSAMMGVAATPIPAPNPPLEIPINNTATAAANQKVAG
jgi:hypothetical protein